MLDKLQQGTTLVVDRYAYSGVAYTSAKHVPGLDVEWCRAPDQGLPAPDIVIFLRLSDSSASTRTGYGEERYESDAFQKQVLVTCSMLDWGLVGC